MRRRNTDASCGRYEIPRRARRYIGRAGDVLVADPHGPRIGLHEADQHVERGRLAGTVGAEQPDDLAPLEAEGDTVHDGALPVVLDELAGLKAQRVYGFLLGAFGVGVTSGLGVGTGLVGW